MRVALCIHGQARGLNLSIFEYLKKNNPDVIIDTFTHTWWDGTGNYPPAGAINAKYLIKAPINFIEAVYKYFSPKRCLLEAPFKFEMNPNFNHFESSDLSHVMPMMYSIQSAFKSSNYDDDNYDWYVKYRFDLVAFSRDLNLNNLDKNVLYVANIHPNGCPDVSIMIIPKKYIDIFRSFFTNLKNYGHRGIEEWVFYEIIRFHNIPTQSLHFQYIHDREQFRVNNI